MQRSRLRPANFHNSVCWPRCDDARAMACASSSFVHQVLTQTRDGSPAAASAAPTPTKHRSLPLRPQGPCPRADERNC